ncbi:hypothetical protein Tco_0082203, partial [Tanacetum coccineum]
MHIYTCKLFESRGCLLLLDYKDVTHSDQLNVYEFGNGYPEWTFKYSVNYWRISSYGAWDCMQRVLCIALGESEQDSFMVIKFDGETLLYKFVLKTFCELSEIESMLSKRNVVTLLVAAFCSPHLLLVCDDAFYI